MIIEALLGLVAEAVAGKVGDALLAGLADTAIGTVVQALDAEDTLRRLFKRAKDPDTPAKIAYGPAQPLER